MSEKLFDSTLLLKVKKKMGVLLEGQATDCIQSKLQIKPHNAVKVISKIIGSIPIYVANLLMKVRFLPLPLELLSKKL